MKAYPRLDADLRQELALAPFIRALNNPQLEQAIWATTPTTLQRAMEVALACENGMRVAVSGGVNKNQKVAPRVHRINNDANDEHEQEEDPVVNLTASVRALSEQVSIMARDMNQNSSRKPIRQELSTRRRERRRTKKLRLSVSTATKGDTTQLTAIRRLRGAKRGRRKLRASVVTSWGTLPETAPSAVRQPITQPDRETDRAAEQPIRLPANQSSENPNVRTRRPLGQQGEAANQSSSCPPEAMARGVARRRTWFMATSPCRPQRVIKLDKMYDRLKAARLQRAQIRRNTQSRAGARNVVDLVSRGRPLLPARSS
jgi:hypothetical protein